MAAAAGPQLTANQRLRKVLLKHKKKPPIGDFFLTVRTPHASPPTGLTQEEFALPFAKLSGQRMLIDFIVDTNQTFVLSVIDKSFGYSDIRRPS